MNGGNGGDGGALVPAVAVVLLVAGGAVAGSLAPTQIGPILAFVGVLVIAIAAQHRQNVSLKGERERLEARLSHERQLQDVEHLRQFLDEAIAAFEDAHMALSELVLDLRSPGRLLGRYEAAARAAIAVKVMRRRVALRFSPDHPVGVAYEEVEEAVDARAAFLFGVLDRLPDEEAMTADDDDHDSALRDNAGVAVGKYAEAVREEVGAGRTRTSVAVESAATSSPRRHRRKSPQ